MEKTLTIGGKAVRFKCTGGFLIRYKQLTGRDPLKDVYEISESLNHKKGKEINFENFNLNVIYDLVWVLARAADSDVPDLLQWLDSFDEFPIIDVFMQLQDLILQSFQSTSSTAAAKKKPIRTIGK